MPRVALRRSLLPVFPARASANSARWAWFSMLAGFASESASTLPEASMMVARAPAARPSWAAISASGWPWSISTRWAKRRVFWVRLRSISVRNEASQALPIMTSRMTAVAAMTIRKTASSLKKMRFFNVSSSAILSLRGLEAVAGAAHGFQVAGIFRVGLDFFADAPDVHIDGARSHVGGIAPDGVEKVITREDASLVAGEEVEQAELGGGSGNHAAADGEGHRRGIDFNVADFHGTRWKRAFEAAQDGFYAGDKFTRAERLGDVVVGAEFEAEDAVRLAAFGGEENYRHGGEAGSLTDGAADLEAIFAGNHDVE